MEIYEPREDSDLLAEEARKHASGNVLDMGTGSGIQAAAAAENSRVKSVLGIDISKKAVAYCRKTYKNKKIRFIVSDLFKDIKSLEAKSGPVKFDTIIFNPPYLPDDPRVKDIALDGGKKGHELLERFFEDANDHLSEDGMILIVFSSLTDKGRVDGMIENALMDRQMLNARKIAFEELYVYKITKKLILKILERRNISGIKKLAKGKRGLIFTGICNKAKVSIKIKREDSDADTIKNEITKIQLLNMYGIGPKFLFSGNDPVDYFVYGFISGEFIMDFFAHAGKKDILPVLRDVFQQMRALDNLGVNKEEMHHPLKHVIISKKGGKNRSGNAGIKVVLVDFERCKKTLKPHNVTQFCQFIVNKQLNAVLKKKGINVDRDKLLGFAREYKNNLSDTAFEKILDLLS